MVLESCRRLLDGWGGGGSGFRASGFQGKQETRRIKAIFVCTMSALNLTILDLKFWERDLKPPLRESGHGVQTQSETSLYPSRFPRAGL